MEFKGTKEKWQVDENLIFADDYFQTHIAVLPSESYDAVTTKANALLISKAPEMLEMLNKALIMINDLDSANSDMMNELYQTKVYKNFTKHSSFCDKLEKLIKEATEL